MARRDDRKTAAALVVCVVAAYGFVACGLTALAVMHTRAQGPAGSVAQPAAAMPVLARQASASASASAPAPREESPSEAEVALASAAGSPKDWQTERIVHLLQVARACPPGSTPAFDVGAYLDASSEAIALAALDYTYARGRQASASVSARAGSTAPGLCGYVAKESEGLGRDEGLESSPASGAKLQSRLDRLQAAVVALLRLGHAPAAKEVAAPIDALLLAGAGCIDDQGDLERERGLPIYHALAAIAADGDTGREGVVASLERSVLRGTSRSKVLMLAVKLGIEGSEPRLRDLLMRHGDKRMAEDYLNCGSAALDEAGRAWAAARGFLVGTGDGSHRVNWGSPGVTR